MTGYSTGGFRADRNRNAYNDAERRRVYGPIRPMGEEEPALWRRVVRLLPGRRRP